MVPLLIVFLPALLACGPKATPTAAGDAANTEALATALPALGADLAISAIPEITQPPGDPMPTASSESTDTQAEAIRLLQGSTQDGLLDDSAITTATEALAALRAQNATAAKMAVRARFKAQELLLGPTDDFKAALEALDAARPAGSDLITAPTGFAAFDALNTEFGVEGVRCRMKCRLAELHFSSPVDVVGAAARYTALAELRYAEPNAMTGDGSSILLTERGTTWKLVVYEGLGDCPAGCTNKHKVFYDYDPAQGSLTRTGEEGQGLPTLPQVLDENPR